MMNEIIKIFIVAIDKRVGQYLSDKKQLKIFLDNLGGYQDSLYNKYSRVKLLILHGDKQLEFYNVYYPLTIKQKHNRLVTIRQKHDIKIKKIEEIYSSEYNCITIIGDAGSGKTTFIKHLFLETITKKIAIPIFIELRNIKQNQPLFDIVQEKFLLVIKIILKSCLKKDSLYFS